MSNLYTLAVDLYTIELRRWCKMKIKLVCQKENYDKYKTMLEKSGFEISEDASLTFKEDDYIQETFLGFINGSYEIIHFRNIIFIESFGHEIILHTLDNKYQIKEKLYEIEGILHDKGFVRINKSTIVNKFGIKELNPTFNSRIILLMKNGSELIVTRNYNPHFKKFIGL
jgi:two-component system response regulator LytT